MEGLPFPEGKWRRGRSGEEDILGRGEIERRRGRGTAIGMGYEKNKLRIKS